MAAPGPAERNSPGAQPLQPNVVAGGTIGSFSARFWLLVLLTGVGAGLAAGLLMQLLRAVQHVAWHYSAGSFLQAVQHTGSTHRLLILLAAGAIAGGAGYWLAHGPGGHAGELTEAIWFRGGDMPFWRTGLRACLSIVLVGMGASLGREAAPKQTGAAIASALSRWRRCSPTERRLLAACGAGAGIAAVYNVPFGGALFGLEVLLGTLKLPLLPPVLAASVIATGTSWLLLPNQPTYHVPAFGLTASQVVWAALAGPLAGLVAVAYVRMISWLDGRKPHELLLLAMPVVVFAVLGGVAIPLPELLGNGKDVVQQAFLGQLGVGLLFALLLLKPLATGACLGSGAPGGLFTPTMTLGAMLGGLLGQGWLLLWPGTPAGPFAIIGAAAVLAASTQGPISALVLTLELTRQANLLVVPLMLAIAGAVLTARALEQRSIYSGRIHTGRAAVAGADAISAAAGYAEVLHRLLLLANRSHALQVVDERGQPVGQITAALLQQPQRLPPLPEIATARDLAEQSERGDISPPR